ncbi:MAG: NUDIX domain-containing protein [Rhodospirillales bacterium]|nr:NUDIX domain-containing protein [Rhodospirillales bacterium]
MDANDVEVVARKTLYQGYFRLDQYIFRHKLFEGGWGEAISREVLERGHAACCLLFDPDLDELVFIEQFRPGAYAALQSPWYDREKDSPWQIEVVAGVIDENETPEDLVRREAMEESGCQVHELELISQYLVTSGCSSETQMLYCGRVDARTASGIHGLAHEGENIRVFRTPTAEAFKMLADGTFNNATVLLAMYWFQQNHPRLRRQWSSDGK